MAELCGDAKQPVLTGSYQEEALGQEHVVTVRHINEERTAPRQTYLQRGRVQGTCRGTGDRRSIQQQQAAN